MSLINDMLQDLDRDHANAEQPLPAGLVAERANKSANMRRYLLPGLALIAVIYALLVEWNLLGIMPEKNSMPADVPQPIALNSKWLKQNSTADMSTVAAPATDVAPKMTAATPTGTSTTETSTSETSTTETIATETSTTETAAQEIIATETIATQTAATELADTAAPHQDAASLAEESHAAVQRLLTAAAQALATNRLTSPVGDNAFQLYKSVLVIEPENPTAHLGIETIQQRYLRWLDKALNENKNSAAQMYWHKAKSVGVEAATLESYQTALIETKPRENSQPAPAPSSQTLSISTPTITPAKAPDDEYIAARLRRDGLHYEREALRLLAQSPDAVQTAVALADLYAERRAVTDLRQLMEQLEYQATRHYAMAQLLVMEGQDQQAQETLATVEFKGDAEQQRLRLLAALRQKSGHYSAAMELYAALVAASPENVADWLGLAVSADKNKLPGTALNAYEKVLRLRHPDQRVMQYARQRQQELSLAASINR